MALMPYRNEGVTDFSVKENKKAFEDALDKVASEKPHFDLLVGGERIETESTLESHDPADHKRVVGTIGAGSPEIARKAVDDAYDYWQSDYRWTDPMERADTLLRAARILRERKHEISATMVYEVSKTWLEADADTAEALDFLEYYARQMMELGGRQDVLYPWPDEDNSYYYQPIGPVVVTPPWNFACAIMAGMTAAALVTGNTAVLSPAPQARITAAKFVDMLLEAGFPPRAIQLVTGDSEVGDALVTHPKTRMIAFTGSKEVGLRIDELAAKRQEGQKWIKRRILEMGGKDALIVDETADPEWSADVAARSAYGFQGQKCSALSRLIVVDEVYDEVLEKLLKKAEEFNLDHPSKDPKMGAVIDEEAFEKITGYIEIGKDEGAELVFGGGSDSSKGWFVEPTIFSEVDPDSRIGQEEIFGPVISVIRARDFDHAVEIFNGVEYGLTGGLMSNNRDRLRRARYELEAGNLYFNRKITRALVGVQPFGGFKMSGTNAKAGGPDYLKLFLDPKSVAERL